MREPKPVLKNLELLGKSERNIILFGLVGKDKSILLDKLCGKNFTQEINLDTYNFEAQFSPSLINNNLIIDFSALNIIIDFKSYWKNNKTLSISQNNKFEKQLREQIIILQAIQIRLICFVIKYEINNSEIIKQFDQIYAIFKKYINNICIILTNTQEMSLTNQTEVENIFDKYNIKNIMFTKDSTSPMEINNKLNNVIEKSIILRESVNLKKELHLLKYLDLLHFKLNFPEKRDEYLEKFQKVKKIIIDEINKTQDNELKIKLYLEFKKYREYELKQFAEESKLNYVDYLIIECILLANETFEDLEEIKELVEKSGIKITKEIDTIFYDKKNTFIKCPSCGQIWLFYLECENATCGRKLTEKEIEENKKRIQQNKEVIKPVGCGANLIWSECLDITQEIKEILI